jgi:hypothetical protein
LAFKNTHHGLSPGEYLAAYKVVGGTAIPRSRKQKTPRKGLRVRTSTRDSGATN